MRGRFQAFIAMLNLRGMIAVRLDRARHTWPLGRFPRLVLGLALMATGYAFYPVFVGAVIAGLFGVLSWCVGMLFDSWCGFARFTLALVVSATILIGFCAIRAWLWVRWIADDGSGTGQPWVPGSGQWKCLRKDVEAVVFGIAKELLLPLFLVLSVAALLSALATLDHVDWARVRAALWAIRDDLAAGLRADPSAAATAIRGHIDDIVTGFNASAERTAAVAGAALSALSSFVIFLFKRRQSALDAARVVLVEVEETCRPSLASVPTMLASAARLIGLPIGTKLIAVSAARELLLLNPGSEIARKLPQCLLVAVVRHFHADLGLSQIYKEIGSDAFANASPQRREEYLGRLSAYWDDTYQRAAFSALFRLALYDRLRTWAP